MNKRIKAKWIKALRSGKYRQTKGMLRVGDAFCCLGVLCNLHAQEHPEVASRERVESIYLGECGVLPLQVKEWAGLKSADAFYGERSTLAQDNDCGQTFDQIAKTIEKHL